VFTNIRFAAPPTGDLRWKKPIPPAPISGIQDGKSGYSCKQILPKRGLNFVGSYNEEPWATSVDELIGGTGSALWPYFTTSSEDCLFLDVYVPAKLIKNPSARKVPVMNWIYGGAVSKCSKTWITSPLTDNCSTVS
jgi:carboxylesterase type B